MILLLARCQTEVPTSSDGSVQSCQRGAPEVCDGVDNDCNPSTGDGADQNGTPCDGPDSDRCNEGVWSCNAGTPSCNDATGNQLDTCDGKDNDCDPSTPDGYGEPQFGTACDSDDTDSCMDDQITCVSARLVCGGADTNQVEGPTFSAVCSDHVDNDCNGFTDLADSGCRSWVIRSLEAPGLSLGSNAMTVDSSEHLHIYVQASGTGDSASIVESDKMGENWTPFFTIVPLDAQTQNADRFGVILDRTSQRPRIAYSQREAATNPRSGSTLFLSRDTAWHKVVVNNEVIPSHTALAQTLLGTYIVAYFETAVSDLRVARSIDGVTWTDTIVDGTGLVGKYPSIAIDSGNRIHILYWDQTEGNLNHTYSADDGVSWTREVVDSAGVTGEWCSVVIDSANRLHVSYYDTGKQDLRYVQSTATGWRTPVTVDSLGDVGKYSNLFLDSQGRPRIAYHDALGNRDAKLARAMDSSGTAWTTEFVEKDGWLIGQYPNIFIDSSDVIHLTYRYQVLESSPGIIHYATAPN